MNRRTFLTMALAGAAAGATVPLLPAPLAPTEPEVILWDGVDAYVQYMGPSPQQIIMLEALERVKKELYATYLVPARMVPYVGDAIEVKKAK